MRRYWTKDDCKNEALKYNFRSDFQKNSKSAYHASIRYKILDDVCLHMMHVGDIYKRCIYSYEFDDNFVYVGLTCNLGVRHDYHLKRGAVHDHIKCNNNNYILKQLTNYINVNLAIEKEHNFVEYYRDNNFNILNTAKTGSLGPGLSKWTKEKCKELSLKCTSRFEFQKKYGGAYQFAFINKFLDDICTHMKSRIWTKEKCQKEALKYTSRSEYRKKSSGSYSAALKNGWKDEVCKHMNLKTRRDFWTFDECRKEASKYVKKGQFAKNSASAYKVSLKNDWLNDFFHENFIYL